MQLSNRDAGSNKSWTSSQLHPVTGTITCPVTRERDLSFIHHHLLDYSCDCAFEHCTILQSVCKGRRILVSLQSILHRRENEVNMYGYGQDSDLLVARFYQFEHISPPLDCSVE